jgi:hypothetical protein
MARRYTGRMSGERYLGNVNKMEVHDLDNEKTGANQCQIDEIIRARQRSSFQFACFGAGCWPRQLSLVPRQLHKVTPNQRRVPARLFFFISAEKWAPCLDGRPNLQPTMLLPQPTHTLRKCSRVNPVHDLVYVARIQCGPAKRHLTSASRIPCAKGITVDRTAA